MVSKGVYSTPDFRATVGHKGLLWTTAPLRRPRSGRREPGSVGYDGTMTRGASPEKLREARDKEVLCLRERLAGKSLAQIEREQGWSNASRIFHNAMQRPENQLLSRQVQIHLEALRIDAMQESIWPRVMLGEPRAIEVAIKVLERRAKMFGLDFADMVNARLVQVEEEKVTLMAAALAAAVAESGLPSDQQRAVTATFLTKIRELEAAQEGVA